MERHLHGKRKIVGERKESKLEVIEKDRRIDSIFMLKPARLIMSCSIG